MDKSRKARVIAFYLPQFHPIPENDAVWGKGFTEWMNVVKAKPMFKGHEQPRLPADLGFYDLRLPEIREQQAALAREAGVEGFCYWHYWMGNGKQLLQRPFQEVLASGKPEFPFCLAWANHDWTTKTWQRGSGSLDTKTMIAKQEYPGDEDYLMHFNTLLPAFKDHRYIRVEDKPLFLIYDPYNFRDVSRLIELWQRKALENGLPGIYFVGMTNATSTVIRLSDGSVERAIPDVKSSASLYESILSLGFNGVNSFGKPRAEMIYSGKYWRLVQKTLRMFFSGMSAVRIDYPKAMKFFFAPEDSWNNVYPSIMPQWDRSPRAGNYDGVYVNATPENFEKHLRDAIKLIENKDDEHRILFLRSWNEWAEGNYVEPDQRYGHGFIDALARVIR